MSADSPVNIQAGAEPVVSAVRGADTFDDMHDTPEEVARYAPLAEAFQWCESVSDEFDRADCMAVVYQRRHRWITRIAAVSATCAVATAIIGLSYHPGIPGLSSPLPAAWLSKLERVELSAALIAVAAVTFGYFSDYRDKWLRYRHQAESCRLLRYQFLIHPTAWREGEESARQWIDSRMSELRVTSLKSAVTQPSPHGPFEGTQIRLPRATLRALTEYYLCKRLNPQKEYLANRTQRNEFSDWIRGYLPWFFFLSIVAVFFKFFIRDFSVRWERLLALLAALLPAAAAG